MTTLILTARGAEKADPNPILHAALAAMGWVRRVLTIRRDRRRLQALPDYLLSDIGISRSEIDHATYYGRSPVGVRISL